MPYGPACEYPVIFFLYFYFLLFGYLPLRYMAFQLHTEVIYKSNDNTTLKVREGRWAADFPRLCVFLNISAISEHIQTYHTSN